MRTIKVVPYDKNWAAEFETIKIELTYAISDFIISIEHVGSTSVPELYAKPIIDIDIVIEHNMFQAVKEKLFEIGYCHAGDLGIAGRESFSYSDKRHLMEHHLYVCRSDSEELKRHIALRDFLRINDDYREQYSKIKIDMAQKYPHDIDEYTNGKQAIIQEIYKKAGL